MYLEGVTIGTELSDTLMQNYSLAFIVDIIDGSGMYL